MDKVWVVMFGTADQAADAFCGCIKVETDRSKALAAMTAYKDELVAECEASVQAEIADGATEESCHVRVSGSESLGYYEVDKVMYDDFYECYITVEEIELSK